MDHLDAAVVVVWKRFGLHVVPGERKGRRAFEVVHEERHVGGRAVGTAAAAFPLALDVAEDVMDERTNVHVVHGARSTRNKVARAGVFEFLSLVRFSRRARRIRNPFGDVGAGSDELQKRGREEVAGARAVGEG